MVYMNNVVWIRDVLEAFNVNDIWFQGMRIWCKNLSASYFNVTKKQMTVVEIDACMDAMKSLMYEENNIQIEPEDAD
jgi:hypothetical protein